MTGSRHPSLEGSATLVTGGATGIGAAHVKAFCAQGARVAFLDVDDGAGRALAEATDALFLPCDLSDLTALDDAMARAAAELGPIDILVNNAADDARHDLLDVTAESFEHGIGVNLRHLIFTSKAVVPGMRARGRGVILNTGSISWRGGFGGMPLYMTAKAGIEGLTRALARDLGPDRIRVNCIVPGWVMTEKQLRERVDEAGRRMIAERQFLPDAVEPSDVAALATWLASDDARACTAQCFVVDGGWI